MNDDDTKSVVACGAPGDGHADGHGFRQYRAPQVGGQPFIEPALTDVPRLLEQNQRCLGDHGEPFDSLRQSARRELIAAAIQYSSTYRDVGWASAAADAPIIMAGHQPAIFHPGVWFKNFALSKLAEQAGALAVNLVIDNDVAAGSNIRVPVLDPVTGDVAHRLVAYDQAGGGVPYEQTTIRDRALFDSFDQRVADAIGPLVKDPCVTELWAHAKAAVARCGVAGCALAQARHGLEGQVGLRTLELPLGVICRTTAFAEFVLSLLDELPRFQSCYNGAAGRYREAHGIRSSAHPVPDLTEDGAWFEAPLWIYGDDSPTRRPAWVRRCDDQLVISDRQGLELSIDSRFPKLAAQQLASHASPNFKLRPRALLTTMYARLVLSDLFLHGIGGAKYDQLGDLIMQDFFGIEPPQFMVISATIQLPGWADSRSQSDLRGEIRQVKRAIRDTRYQGERFADRVDLDPKLVHRKQQLLAAVPPPGRRLTWQHEIERVNQTLAGELSELRSQLERQLQHAQRKAANLSLLGSREHPFCLFPLEYLTEMYRSMLD